MTRACKKLIVVAHPDDETLFFGGLMQREARHGFHVVCVTNGGADGRAGARADEFAKACRTLKAARHGTLGLPDVYENRLDIQAVTRAVAELAVDYKEIYTHSVVGDYGHPHHQDIALAVARAVKKPQKLFHVAWNTYPQKRLALTAREFETKRRILQSIYGIETQRFLNLLPCRSEEGFVEISLKEIEEIYAFLSGQTASLNASKLKAYKGLSKFLAEFGSHPMPRPF